MSWSEMTIGDLVTLQRGHDLTDSQRKEGTVPVIGSAGPNGTHNIARQKGPGFTVGRSGGSIGKVTFVPSDYWPHNTCLYAKDLKGNGARFLAYFLSTQNLASLNSGAAQPSLNRNFVHSQRVLAPDPNTQERIAGVLSAYDDLIENNRRRIAVLEQAARLLYREWFVHFRFPGSETTKFVDGLPEGWERKKLGQVCATNKSSHKKGRLPKVVRYVDIGSVSTGQIDDITEYEAEAAPGRARRIVEPFDTIWSNVRPNLKAYALVTSPRENDVFSTGFTVLHAETVSPLYLYFTVTTDDFVQHLVNHSTGASYPAVRSDDFERAEVVAPTSGVMAEFHAKSENIFLQREKLREQNLSLAKARDLLLPRLMDGRLPIPE